MKATSPTTPTSGNRRATAKSLAEGYGTGKRLLDLFSCSVFGLLWTVVFVALARYYVHNPSAGGSDFVFAPLAVIAALFVADLMSGLAHWGFDTWGEVTTPVFGPFIRSFREHHVDQSAITRHDFVETNGDSCLTCIPVLAAFAYLGVGSDLSGDSLWVAFLAAPSLHAFILMLTFAVAMTNQIHKSSHQVAPPPIMKLLMKTGLVLTAKDHRVHHSGEFDKSYCITTGWLNGPLDKINFWRRFEELITATTGAIPRANDKALLGDGQ